MNHFNNFINKPSKKIVSTILLGILLVSTLVVPAFAEAGTTDPTNPNLLTKVETFKTTDKPFVYKDFEKKILVNDKKYELKDIKYKELSSKQVTKEKDCVIKDADPNKYNVGDKFTIDEKEYVVKSINVTDTTITDRTQNLTWEIKIGSYVDAPTPAETWDTSYNDPYSGKDLNYTATLKNVRFTEPTWRADVSVPIVVYGIDGEYYQIGKNVLIRSEKPLEDMQEHQDTILKELNLDTSKYKLTSFKWESGTYVNDKGVMCRNVIATGERYASDYTATYALDNAELPDCKGYQYEIKYIKDVDGVIEYSAQATATYEMVKLSTSVKIAIVLGVVLFVTLIVLILYVLSKKRKDKSDKKANVNIDDNKKKTS